MSIDISGPHKESVQGWRYFLVARHTATYDENGKLDLGSIYTITIGFRQRADASVQQFCAQHNIVHTTIIPYQQFQNGKAEKFIGDIKRKAKTLMMTSGVPDTFWGFAVQHATTLQNITGLNQAKTTPHLDRMQYQAYTLVLYIGILMDYHGTMFLHQQLMVGHTMQCITTSMLTRNCIHSSQIFILHHQS
jgi:hypothetical protein